MDAATRRTRSGWSLNRAGLRGGVSVGDIEARLHVRVKHTIPDDQPLATLTVNRGVPAVLSHRRSALARAFRKLAEALAEEMPAERAGGERDRRARRPGPDCQKTAAQIGPGQCVA